MSVGKTIPAKVSIEKRIMDWWVASQQPPVVPVKQPGPFPGPYPPFWEKYATQIRQIIEEYGLQDIEHIATELKADAQHKELAEAILRWRGTHGGMKAPHLHYESKIYPVNQSEWNAFAKSALATFQQKFAATPGSVTFENFCVGLNTMQAE